MLLFFNYLLNSFVVVEVKNALLKPQDIGQVEFYTKLIDRKLKQSHHNPTIGLIMVKKKNKLVMEYSTLKDNLFITSFNLINN